MSRRPTCAPMKILEAQLYSMNARSVILSRPIESPSPRRGESGGRGAAAMDLSLCAQRLNPSPRRGEGGGRFGHRVRVLTQRAQRAIQNIAALLSATRAA